MSNLLLFYFIIELILVLLLLNKFKRVNAIVIGYFLFFIYAQSAFLNYLLTGNNYIQFVNSSSLNFSLASDAFFMASTYYFLFMVTYGVTCVFINVGTLFDGVEKNKFIKISFKLKMFVGFIICFFLFYHLQTFGMDRVQKKQYSFLPFAFVVFYIGYYVWALLYFYSKKKNTLFYILTFFILYHSIFSFEREYIVLVGLVLLFDYKKYIKGYLFLVIALLGFFILTYWKYFYLFVIIAGNPISTFFTDVDFNLKLSNNDSIAGMSLLTNYFENDIYEGYYLSYITNSYNQLYRMFFDSNYASLAEYSSDYYTKGEMGTAFSMILESILNFGVLGPIVLSLILIKIIIKTLRNKIHLYDFYSIFLIFMMVKFVRTELTVLLKLYVMPFILFILLVKIFFKKEIKYI